MALPAEQAKLVADTWALVKPDLDKHAMVFFLEIFTIAPAAKGLFKFLADLPPDAPLDGNPRLQKHASGALLLAGDCAAKLGDAEAVEALKPAVFALGRRHARYGVIPAHFPIVGQALLNALEKGFGPAWTPELKAAWSAAYDVLAAVMGEGLAAGLAAKTAAA